MSTFKSPYKHQCQRACATFLTAPLFPTNGTPNGGKDRLGTPIRPTVIGGTIGNGGIRNPGGKNGMLGTGTGPESNLVICNLLSVRQASYLMSETTLDSQFYFLYLHSVISSLASTGNPHSTGTENLMSMAPSPLGTPKQQHLP